MHNCIIEHSSFCSSVFISGGSSVPDMYPHVVIPTSFKLEPMSDTVSVAAAQALDIALEVDDKAFDALLDSCCAVEFAVVASGSTDSSFDCGTS